MAPILVSPKSVFRQTETEASQSGLDKFPAVDFRRKNRNGSGAGFEIFRMLVEFIEYRGKRNENSGAENQDLFPEIPDKMFLGDEQEKQKSDDDGRGDAESDIGVEAQPENESGENEIGIFFGPQSLEQEIGRKSKNHRHHDGAETDAGEIDRPIGKGGQIGADESGPLTAENFFRKQIDSENRERAEQNRRELERQYARTHIFYEKRLDVDE